MSTPISAAQAGTISIGDFTVNRIGLGTNRITNTPEAHDLLKRALELGINFIDTAHLYGDGESEKGISSAIAPYGNGVVVATKGGANGNDPQQLRRELEESLERLQIDRIDLYQLHRVDENIPLEETMQLLKSFQEEGLIRHIGLSEVTVDQLQLAMQIAPIVSVQNEYNVINRKHEALVDFCTQHQIVFIPWFPLGGLFGDTAKVEERVADIARKLNVPTRQVALKWLLQRSPIILPIPGTLSPAHLEDNLRAATLELSQENYEALTN
ncbi:aldo/keto reductase [Paenibacillus radicis (ex Gao et al. 2016)]|uniref:Oxidoreductase n=1 Tax=Paenibacillus radicis (ex Gao et al. 2016) TaxID=1737354 RepID=A0A917LVN2_9BACL|nr:aldo/keto reductase [Paenibacillus radicis (ex Gao et al. 2016)]GGG58055.1 oxidoreductase [Paenibacillus radicis (ex Gao et al. 2016)]